MRRPLTTIGFRVAGVSSVALALLAAFSMAVFELPLIVVVAVGWCAICAALCGGFFAVCRLSDD